ncbi:MAG: DUF3108 domain-containing protein [Elusimicrobiaceae bacterium]|nr:DUF3108 domain-containing protein [Elusimicrobiaceae bacterium]
MKKGLAILGVCILLVSCQCTCKPTKPVVTDEVITPEVSTLSTQMEVSQPAPVLKEVQPATSSKPTKPVATPVQKSLPTQPADTPAKKTTTPAQTSAPAPNPVFDAAQAKEIIAKARAKQALSKPQTDKAVFKKEPILPLEGRLLSPMSYEPILADNTHAPWSNESLQYGIYYSFVKAGTAYIKTRGLTSVNGKMAYLIQTTAFSASVIDAVFKVRDVNYSWLDVNTLHSLGYSQSVREGNYIRDEWLAFDPANHRYYGEVKKKKEPRTIAGKLDIEVLDMLSSMYYVRKEPLTVGKDVVFDIVNREKQYPLVVKVLGKETVKTDAGKFNCWVVEPQFRGEGIFIAKGKSLKVWLTDDEYRMPVKMEAEVFIGSVYAELLAYQRN